MSERQPYKHLDLPKVHLAELGHYVPSKARDEEEIARRRQQRPGVLIAEQQRKGVAIASLVLPRVEEPEARAFVRRVISRSGINTAWHVTAQNAKDVQRRVNDLPRIGDPDDPWRPDAETLWQSATRRFENAVYSADAIVVATRWGSNELSKKRKQFGRFLGSTSLILACNELGDRVEYGTAFDVQDVVRTQCLVAIDDARNMHREVGSHPTLAGLADPDSDLSVFWRRNAPDGAYQALEQAVAEPLAA